MEIVTNFGPGKKKIKSCCNYLCGVRHKVVA